MNSTFNHFLFGLILDDEESEEEESELKKLYPETYKTNEPRLLRGKYYLVEIFFSVCESANSELVFVANSQPNSDDEEEEDIDYSPEEDEFKKVEIYEQKHLALIFFPLKGNSFKTVVLKEIIISQFP